VTAIVLLAIAAIFFSLGSRGGTAYYKTVEEIATDDALIGERVKVGGAVVPGSWDKKTNPMTFEIRDEGDTDGTGSTIRVVYTEGVPATFGDGVTAIITGELGADGTLTSGDMITKCPSKYESATGAMPVSDLVAGGASMVGTTVKVTGYIKPGTIAPPGGDARFVVTNDKGFGAEVSVAWEGALPQGMADGSKVVLTGAIEEDGAFVATNVALEGTGK
jgi:cytochrome c-type biogenesis protein CcmE